MTWKIWLVGNRRHCFCHTNCHFVSAFDIGHSTCRLWDNNVTCNILSSTLCFVLEEGRQKEETVVAIVGNKRDLVSDDTDGRAITTADGATLAKVFHHNVIQFTKLTIYLWLRGREHEPSL